MPLVETIQAELGDEQRQVRDAYGVVLVLVLVSTMMLIAAGAPLPTVIVALAALLQVGALDSHAEGVGILAYAIGPLVRPSSSCSS